MFSVTIKAASLSEEKASDLIFFFFFFLSICCLATSVVWPNIWGLCVFWFCSDRQRGSDGFENCASLESMRVLWGADEKQAAHFWDYKIPEKLATWYYKSNLASDILAVLVFQYFPSKHPLLMRKEKKLSFCYLAFLGWYRGVQP